MNFLIDWRLLVESTLGWVHRPGFNSAWLFRKCGLLVDIGSVRTNNLLEALAGSFGEETGDYSGVMPAVSKEFGLGGAGEESEILVGKL
ncbi:MAG: hypothetical protein OXL68_10695 [Paracoccaceae bacterium]|nr:hypothetical protein [Paracoccaceae bacterium]